MPTSQPVRRTGGAVQRRWKASAAPELLARLRELEPGSWIVAFGSSLLLAVLPLVILLGSLADERIDDDVSRHIGLSRQGAQLVAELFRHRPTHSAAPIVLGLIVALLGTAALAGSLQVLYERVFEHPKRGRDVKRSLLWTAGLLTALVLEGTYDGPVRAVAGDVVRDLLSFVLTAGFFAWTMHFLLAGRVGWRRLVRPALTTALLWLGLALFSSLYFSQAIVSEHKLYGELGVIFVLATWFVGIGGVLMVGAVWGALWQERAERGAPEAGARGG